MSREKQERERVRRGQPTAYPPRSHASRSKARHSTQRGPCSESGRKNKKLPHGPWSCCANGGSLCHLGTSGAPQGEDYSAYVVSGDALSSSTPKHSMVYYLRRSSWEQVSLLSSLPGTGAGTGSWGWVHQPCSPSQNTPLPAQPSP